MSFLEILKRRLENERAGLITPIPDLEGALKVTEDDISA